MFIEHDINAEMVIGDTPKPEREQILHDLEFGDVQVVVNVAVLTEGFDAPPVSCVVLTRPCSFKSTMVQMIGRGLRILDPEIYPDQIKKDCIVLDFGSSILTHGALDEAANLDGKPKDPNGEAPEKQCPECGFITLLTSECALSVAMSSKAKTQKNWWTFTLTEYDLMELSPFLWMDIFRQWLMPHGNGLQWLWCSRHSGRYIYWASQGSERAQRCAQSPLAVKVQAMSAADDFMREIEDSSAANKSKRWLNERATDKQRNALRRGGVQVAQWTSHGQNTKPRVG